MILQYVLIPFQVLRRSESSDEFEIQDIVKSTIGIIFLGTPHRGSQDLASLGDIVRSVAGTTLRIDSNAVLLRALGADSPELELSRESFFTQWRTFGFKVKTFQEAFPMTGINVGPMNQKVGHIWKISGTAFQVCILYLADKCWFG